MTPKETALLLAKALDSRKGINIKVLETGHLTTLADYFVLCSATSSTQIRALSDACEKAMKEQVGEAPHHVVVHIFNEEAREFYDLERLWSDATPVDISDILVEN